MSRKEKAVNGQLAALKADDQLLVSKLNAKRLELQLNAEQFGKLAEAKKIELLTLLSTLAKRRGLVFGQGIDFNFDTMSFYTIPAQTLAVALPDEKPKAPEK